MNDVKIKTEGKGGVSFCGVLAIIFVVLKLIGVIDWSWLWVLAPIWIPIILVVVVILMFMIFTRRYHVRKR